jgi:hypothetical protein
LVVEDTTADVPVPGVTMPLRVAVPEGAAVCANAGTATAINTRTV